MGCSYVQADVELWREGKGKEKWILIQSGMTRHFYQPMFNVRSGRFTHLSSDTGDYAV